jgi:hypothetical protein
LQKTSKTTTGPKYDKDYITRVIAITLVFYLTVFLSGRYGLNFSLLVVDSISLILTPLIWRHDGILKLEFKAKYVLYYLLFLGFTIILEPKDISNVINILYRNGFREEALYRFFMVGIFLKYGYSDTKESQKKFLIAIVCSNLLFMLMHNYSLIGLFSVFIFGLVFSLIYFQGGLLSAVLAHTLHNVYTSRGYSFLSLLLIIPLLGELFITSQYWSKLRNSLSGNISEK